MSARTAPAPHARSRAARLVLLAASVLLALTLCAAPGAALAAPANPFEVAGPAAAYTWDGTTLHVTGADVTVTGMAAASDSAAAGDVTVEAGGSLAVGAGVRIGTLAVAGGTLDLSAVAAGEPLTVDACSLGGGALGTLVAPFGATSLAQLVDAGSLVASDGMNVVEDGERIGTLRSDGSFAITATRAVTFVGWDGAALETQTVPLFSAAVAPEVASPDGFAFTGWDRPFDRVVEDATVTALFAPAPASEPQPAPDPQPESAPAPSSSSGSASSSGTAAPSASAGNPQARITSNGPQARVGSSKALAKTADSLPVAALAGAAAVALAALIVAKKRS
ncbi:hypothetical protein [Eggerthella sinensis]|uniref:hypothetical protein n=1 Tax=Eggerthella sinensis TaxID=242230 RepID=UPI00266DA69E|nr:hypothetical protein [Eggerthella sinensis]